MDITTLIITKNAEDTLKRTLESVIGWVNDIIIIDDFSTDNTKQIARDCGCTVITHHADNFGEQRAFALTQVATDWTLVLDSDEVLTSANKTEVEAAVQNSSFDGYHLQFRNHLFGKKLRQGELHKKLVLFKTRKASIVPKDIHEQYKVQGRVGELPSEVLHYSYRSVMQIAKKFFDYSIRQAKEYKRINKKYGAKELFLNPLHMFYARFIIDKGYKDGVARIFLDKAFALMEFFSYVLIPFVKIKKRIAIDCGSYSITGTVQSGIDRLVQGIFSHSSPEYDYFWFGFAKDSPHALPIRFFSQLWLPLKTIVSRCDVFIGAAGNIPGLLDHFPIKKILFLYDFGFFSSPEKYVSSAKRLQDQTNSSIRSADMIVVLHDEICKEFEKRYPQYSHKVVVIPAGADHLKKIEEKTVFIQPKRPFVLSVGVVKPVKRIDKILSVIGDTYCVIAGPQEEDYAKTLRIGKTQNVQFIKNFNDGQLKWLYKNADVMIYTSEQEGFCYPVLEALTSGLPVIAFDLPLFRKYCEYFPHLTLVKTDEEMKTELKKINGKKFSVSNNHPYVWHTFNERLTGLWQSHQSVRQKNQKIGFIVVLYKTSSSEKKRLEQEIKTIGLSSYSIYWIDNSTNGKGYAAGINEGIRKGLSDSCDLFIALNPDISLTHFIADNMYRVANEFDVWGFGMKQGNTIYYGGEIDAWRLSGGLIQTKPKIRFPSVDFISGSTMGFSRYVIQTIGLWDESYFMYYEDVDYCIRAQKAGFQVGIDSSVVYDHFEVSAKNKRKEQWIAKSRWKFFWKYANWKQKLREMMRLPKTIVKL